MEDREIVALFHTREEGAIRALIEKYGEIGMKLAKNILQNKEDAEECLDDAYLGMWNSIPPASPDPLRSYFLRIVRNLAVKKYHTRTAAKRNSLYDTTLDEFADCIPAARTVEEEFDAAQTAKLIDEFLASQEQCTRVAFVRRYYFADSLAELSTRMGMSRHRLAVRLHRTREKLKKFLMTKGVTL